ncbi:hypothetical protein STCU_07177 [Strigomonas culicis]|uniref:Uncharacterized protein n=1 Tax=Strigomonas culicis TaxID=28005 RepID=S9VMK1_9TRYP|nr:hypothetical protein STCU_07177 [Strigomonas culicis]|eukprot:EPY24445.1 hypothetical protein STCU_07177 [Strigomonas culicis]
MAVASFYGAHAHFYLGYMCEMQLQEPALSQRRTAALREAATEHYAIARANEAYVLSYERNVEEAIAAADYRVALRLLHYLQKMAPDNADYYLTAAHVCHLMEDTEGEWVALSEALARGQSSSARRATVLARGMVFAEKVRDYSRAIRDFTIAINIVADEPQDRCTPIAYLNRAEAFRSRAKTTDSMSPHEDRSASLDDYRRFVESVQEVKTAEGCTDADICDPQFITDAMIILAAGAFEQENYWDANMYFSTAITRGWRPVPPHEALGAEAQAEVDLYDKVYLSAARCVIEENSPVSDPFKVTYASRDWSSSDAKRAKASDKKDAERTVPSLPSLLFMVLDTHYTELRALEPTMFTKLENQFLALWDPYRTEMNRRKEEANGTRGSRRSKRHVS